MKINRIRNPATIVPGAQWMNGLDSIGMLGPTPPPEPTPEPQQHKLMPLPPLPPVVASNAEKWKAALLISEDVVGELRHEADFNPAMLMLAVKGMIDAGKAFTVADVIAAYRSRKNAK
jgi:hypothetical protein